MDGSKVLFNIRRHSLVTSRLNDLDLNALDLYKMNRGSKFIVTVTSSQTRRTLATTAYTHARASNALHSASSEREAAAVKRAASQDYNRELYSGTHTSSSNESPKYVHATAPQSQGEKISDPRVKKQDHGESPGPFPTSGLYTHHPPASEELVAKLNDTKGEARMSSASVSPAHPTTTTTKDQGGGLGRAGEVPRSEEGVGSSSAVRFRSAPGEMAKGGDGGLGLMNKGDS